MLELARQAFEQYDVDKSGFLSRAELKAVLRDTRLGLSARQVRLVLLKLDTSGDGQLSVDEFAPLMAEVLVEQYKRELRAAAWDDLELELRRMLTDRGGGGDGAAAAEGAGSGGSPEDAGSAGASLYRSRLVDVLLKQHMLSISRMQANAIVATVPEEADGTIAIDRFVPIAASMLRALSAPDAVMERSRMLERSDFTPIELMGGREREVMEANFGEAFAKYDVDSNKHLVSHAPARSPAALRHLERGGARTRRPSARICSRMR
jgi:hypothetical protein